MLGSQFDMRAIIPRPRPRCRQHLRHRPSHESYYLPLDVALPPPEGDDPDEDPCPEEVLSPDELP